MWSCRVGLDAFRWMFGNRLSCVSVCNELQLQQFYYSLTENPPYPPLSHKPLLATFTVCISVPILLYYNGEFLLRQMMHFVLH